MREPGEKLVTPKRIRTIQKGWEREAAEAADKILAARKVKRPPEVGLIDEEEIRERESRRVRVETKRQFTEGIHVVGKEDAGFVRRATDAGWPEQELVAEQEEEPRSNLEEEADMLRDYFEENQIDPGSIDLYAEGPELATQVELAKSLIGMTPTERRAWWESYRIKRRQPREVSLEELMVIQERKRADEVFQESEGWGMEVTGLREIAKKTLDHIREKNIGLDDIDLNGALRGDPKGTIAVNQARKLLGLPPIQWRMDFEKREGIKEKVDRERLADMVIDTRRLVSEVMRDYLEDKKEDRIEEFLSLWGSSDLRVVLYPKTGNRSARIRFIREIPSDVKVVGPNYDFEISIQELKNMMVVPEDEGKLEKTVVLRFPRLEYSSKAKGEWRGFLRTIRINGMPFGGKSENVFFSEDIVDNDEMMEMLARANAFRRGK